jgi:hypothetical protein
VLAALLVAGPTDAGGWWIRVVATVVGGAVGWAAARAVPRRTGVTVSLVAAVAALVLAVAA